MLAIQATRAGGPEVLEQIDAPTPQPGPGQHLGALVDAHDGAPVAPHQLPGHQAGARGDVEHALGRTGVHSRDHRPAPARILPEAEQRGDQVVAVLEPREQLQRTALPLRADGLPGGQLAGSLPEAPLGSPQLTK